MRIFQNGSERISGKKEREQLTRLHTIVEQAIAVRELILNNLAHPAEETLTRGQLISDKFARFGGSWPFIGIFGLLLLSWIVYNSVVAVGIRFDPDPFILLNLVLSFVAAFQAPLIMMSQNRQEEKDRKSAVNDFMINLKAELEVGIISSKVDLLIEEQIRSLYEIQARQMELLQEIAERVSPGN